MADPQNPVAKSDSDKPKDSGALKNDSPNAKTDANLSAGLAQSPTSGTIAPFTEGLDAGATAGTRVDVATQGFDGVKIQADQQALPGHEGEGVPLGGNPLKNEFKDPKRKDSKPYKVAGTRFNYGGGRFAKGETIYLTDREHDVLKNHLEG
jgi:hypothetical protein